MVEEILRRIKDKTAEIGIIGLGYVGLPLAREFLNSGFIVTGFDIDEEKVGAINGGRSYIDHISSDFISTYVSRKKLRASGDYGELKKSDAVIICVPTPLGTHYDPNLEYVVNSVRSIAKHLRRGHIVVLESTTYPGTTDDILLGILEESGLRAGEDFFLGYSPEREDPGNRDFSTKRIPKIVSGVTNNCRAVIAGLYSEVIDTVVPVSSTKVAESAKLLENIYRAVNIALVNELKIILAKLDIDVWEVIEAANTKPFGFHAFYPGPGLGGHCIPIDPFYLTWKAREYDIHTRFIELAGEINSSMPYYVVSTAIKALNSVGKSIRDAKVLVLGAAYKPDVDDMRESPSLKLMDLLLYEGADVSYNDPYIEVLPPTRKYAFDMRSMVLTPENLTSMDLVVIATNHSCYDWDLIASNSNLILDTRNALSGAGIVKDKIWKA